MTIIRKENKRKVDPAVLADIVDRIVKLAKPQKIITIRFRQSGSKLRKSDVNLLSRSNPGRFTRGRC